MGDTAGLLTAAPAVPYRDQFAPVKVGFILAMHVGALLDSCPLARRGNGP